MLKEAIADAKTIKETAIASAKSALEEAFTPQLTAMFAERLNELELEEEKEEKEETEEGMYETRSEEEGDNLDEDFSLEELLAELSREDNEETTDEGMDEEPLEENLMLEDMSDEEIEELVMQVIDDMIASGKLMPGEGEEEGEEEGEDIEDMDEPEMDDESDIEGEEEEIDEDINLEELLAEMEEAEEEPTNEIVGTIKKGAQGIRKFFTGVATSGEKEEKKKVFMDALSKIEGEIKAKPGEFMDIYGGGEKFNQSKWNETKARLEKEAAKNNYIGTLEVSYYGQDKQAMKYKPGTTQFQKTTTGASSQTGGGGSAYSVDEITMNEMEETIAELRRELNEVNLLNAKLLYTNKIFKTKNLTESEKIKVLSTFDKAETVKEVKLVYETLTESLKTTTVAKKNPIKESLGSASKTISTATPKQPIIEVNNAFARMQQLAGLRK